MDNTPPPHVNSFVLGPAVINTHTCSGSNAAFYMGLKSKVGLVAAEASALRINLIKHAPGIACFNGVVNRASASPA
jgi:hypothetical protein